MVIPENFSEGQCEVSHDRKSRLGERAVGVTLPFGGQGLRHTIAAWDSKKGFRGFLTNDVPETKSVDGVARASLPHENESLKLLRIPIIGDGGEGTFMAGKTSGIVVSLATVAHGQVVDAFGVEFFAVNLDLRLRVKRAGKFRGFDVDGVFGVKWPG
jgi:hypothetical protein